MTFTPSLPKSDSYEILFWSQPNANRATNVPVIVFVDGKKIHKRRVNQRSATNETISLGVFNLPKGERTRVVISNEGTVGYVVADGVQFVPKN